MRVIKLTHGVGNGVDHACLMTASNMLIGRGEDGDNNHCVCPVIQGFIIQTNDSMPIELLGKLYGDLAWEILGTRTDDLEVMMRRAYFVVDWAVRRIAPIALEASGLDDEASKLRALAAITDSQSAKAATYAANAAAYAANAASYAASDATNAATNAAYAAAYAANAAAKVANAAAYAANAASYAASDATNAAAYAANAAAKVANAAANAAAYAASAARAAYAARAARAANAANAASYAAYAATNDIWGECPDVIRAMAAIGDKRPQEVVLSRDDLCNALSPMSQED